MTTPLVNASKHDGVMVLELRNPPANTYSYEMMRELEPTEFFCAGSDIKMLQKSAPYFKYAGAV
jgi:enoyl-CoA hydratase